MKPDHKERRFSKVDQSLASRPCSSQPTHKNVKLPKHKVAKIVKPRKSPAVSKTLTNDLPTSCIREDGYSSKASPAVRFSTSPRPPVSHDQSADLLKQILTDSPVRCESKSLSSPLFTSKHMAIPDVELRRRLEQMEIEENLIKQRWFNNIHPENLTKSIKTNKDFRRQVISRNFTPPRTEEFYSQSLLRPMPSPASPPPTYLNRIVDVVENRIFEDLIEDTLVAELDNFESMADILVEHLLQSELLVCS